MNVTINLIILTGGSGTGKTSICSKLVLKDSYVQYKPFTTRKKRKYEVDNDYRFIEPLLFKNYISRKKLLFFDQLFENYYGVGWDINEFIANNSQCIIILPTWRVSEFMKHTNYPATVFHLINNSPVLASKRLKNRSEDKITERIENLDKQNRINIIDSIRIEQSSSLNSLYKTIKFIISERKKNNGN